MPAAKYEQAPILVAGEDKVAFSLTICLLQAGHVVTLYTKEPEKAQIAINTHVMDINAQVTNNSAGSLCLENLELTTSLDNQKSYQLAIATTREDLTQKQAFIQQLEQILPADAVIAISMESMALSTLQAVAQHPNRIIGANWVEPVHTTYFLELISNAQTEPELLESFCRIAATSWQKAPYVVKEYGIRSRMMGALVREAFYLIEKGYVGVEDIDRACRNDAGYYLPFAGNFRYMDLMGTYAYGMVMKDLNPELSKDQHLPAFFTELLAQGKNGMTDNNGFYNYQAGEAEKWEAVFRQFSYQIQQIIQKYPFNYTEATTVAGKAFV